MGGQENGSCAPVPLVAGSAAIVVHSTF